VAIWLSFLGITLITTLDAIYLSAAATDGLFEDEVLASIFT